MDPSGQLPRPWIGGQMPIGIEAKTGNVSAHARSLTVNPQRATMIQTLGPTLEDALAKSEIAAFILEQLSSVDLDGRSVCVLVPDGTRTCPLPLLIDAVHAALHGRVTALTVLVALGTHAPMSPATLDAHVGRHPGMVVRNHEWSDPTTFVTLGSISANRVAELSGGLLHTGVDVRVNRLVVDADVTLIVGPVFPHEVVGFSGGNKYLFPGVSGPEMIDVTHWLGALLTSAEIIGTRGTTPVRALIDEAAALVPSQLLALCVVTRSGGGLHAATFGEPLGAWAAAADIAADHHVRYLDTPVRRVLSLIPDRYDDMWTGAKGFYKVEPIMADGGQVVLYAPHITQISAMHPGIVDIGYHCRDYFVTQWDRFSHLPWGDIAHSTHLRGAGTFIDGEEHGRVTVTLATGIPESTVRAVNLDYLDPATIDVDAWAADANTLVVPDAGEGLYRLR